MSLLQMVVSFGQADDGMYVCVFAAQIQLICIMERMLLKLYLISVSIPILLGRVSALRVLLWNCKHSHAQRAHTRSHAQMRCSIFPPPISGSLNHSSVFVVFTHPPQPIGSPVHLNDLSCCVLRLTSEIHTANAQSTRYSHFTHTHHPPPSARFILIPHSQDPLIRTNALIHTRS